MQGSGIELDTFPMNSMRPGGPGKDGIPALTNPRFVAPNPVSYVADGDLVMGLVVDGVARAYPELRQYKRPLSILKPSSVRSAV